MRKVVIDTNVFVSALLSADGASRGILRLALRGEIKPMFSNALFAEYQALMGRSHLWVNCVLSQSEREDLLDALIASSDWVAIRFLWRPNLSDEADIHVLELAVAGGAPTIITANIRDFMRAELLFPNVKILTPAAFLQERQIL
jgi:putative PIN family toxin of toxin-antitoxin system